MANTESLIRLCKQRLSELDRVPPETIGEGYGKGYHDGRKAVYSAILRLFEAKREAQEAREREADPKYQPKLKTGRSKWA